MKLQPVIYMRRADNYKIVGTYFSVEKAAEDTLIPIDEIYTSLAEGAAINGHVWNRQYVPIAKTKSPEYQQSNKKATNKKAVLQLDLKGNVISVFDSVAQATKATNITNIDKAARGLIQTAGGFIWEYK